MENQRVILWTTLGLKNMEHRRLIQGVGTEAVDRLGRNAQKTAVFNNRGSLLNGGMVFFGVEQYGFHVRFPNLLRSARL